MIRSLEVALRKESVDRNFCVVYVLYEATRSLSARRAWIEITKSPRKCAEAYVALRKESVDRNTEPLGALYSSSSSLSARRAWIEMSICE